MTPPMSIALDAPEHRPTAALRLQRVSTIVATVAGVIGAAVLIGYATRTPAVVRLSPRLPPMYPNAALGLSFGGLGVVAGARSWRWRGTLAAAALGAIGVIGLCLNIAEPGPTWFEWLFPDDFVTATTPVGGRPVAETCVAFILLAGALGSLTWQRWAVLGQALAVAGTSVGLSAVVGYILGVDRTSLGGSLVYVGMALHTGLGIALVGMAAILARPTVGFVAQLLDGGISGEVTRRATLVVAAAPIALIVAGVLLSHTLPTDELSQSVFSVLQVGVLGAAVLIPAGLITRTERQLRDELDRARRRGEHQSDVGTVIEAITGEMSVVSPVVPGWEIAMRYQPATGHLAGDSVQVHHRLEPRPASLIAIIDIAGHDAHAAVVAYGLRAHIGALWDHGADLASIATSANTKLVRRGTIATGVLLSIDHDTHDVELVNAGHPSPLHVHDGDLEEWSRTGPLFGLEGAHHSTVHHTVRSGELVVAYTDGLIEARSVDGRQLGEPMLHRVIRSFQHQPADDIAAACLDAALEHTRARLRDDALVVVARRATD